MRRARLLLGLALGLASCTREVAIDMPPQVYAGEDVDAVVPSVLALGASAWSGHSTVVRLDWTLVAAPDPGQVHLVPKGDPVGSVLDVYTGDIPGIYVLGVAATDAQGLTSSADYVHLLLRPKPAAQALRLTCAAGCKAVGDALEADEGASLTLLATADHPELAAGYEWKLNLVRDPSDPFREALAVQTSGPTATVGLPRVARAARLEVSATALGDSTASASLSVLERNSADEPPQIVLEARQPGAAQPVGGSALVLPGDALLVTALVSDPNGDAVTCSLPAPTSSAALVRVDSADPCRATIYPLADGAVEIRAQATTASPAATASAQLKVTVSKLALDAEAPGLAAVAVDGAGRVLAAGAQPLLYLWTEGGRTSFAASAPGGAAAALSAGAAPELGIVGYSGTGTWSRLDVGAQALGVDLTWPGKAESPAKTRGLAAGSGGKVFGATDEGVAVFQPAAGLRLWPSPGGLSVDALAAAPSAGEKGLVWAAAGNAIFALNGEDPAAWPASPPSALTVLFQRRVAALAAVTGELTDLWAATVPGPGASAAGLLLFRDSVDPSTGQPRLNAPEELFAQVSGVLSIGVEREGPYAGDVWAVAGDRLVRVSRAEQNGASGARPALALQLDAQGSAKARAVAVNGSGKRKVAVATDLGLLQSP